MNNVQIFSNSKFGQVRAIMINDVPYFAGIDVARTLGYVIPDKAIRDHVAEVDRILMKLSDIQDPSKIEPHMRGSNIMMITESGVYSLIFGSNLPSAKDFQRWVTSEVLPSIRRHGAYLSQQKVEEILSNPDTIIELATKMKEERAKRLEAEQRASILEYQNETHQQVIKESAPKVQYYNAVLMSASTYTATQIAKELGMSAVTLNKKLREKGVQYYQSGQWLLYSKHQDKGYTETRTHIHIDENRQQKSTLMTVWTEKGREFIHRLL